MYILSTKHYLLPTTYLLPPTTYCLLSTTHCLPPSAYHLLPSSLLGTMDQRVGQYFLRVDSDASHTVLVAGDL